MSERLTGQVLGMGSADGSNALSAASTPTCVVPGGETREFLEQWRRYRTRRTIAVKETLNDSTGHNLTIAERTVPHSTQQLADRTMRFGKITTVT